ncbi:HNH endonuclease [Bacillus wiedmannii]|uniref:HNH endonuclease n=1 Tax=Bacillus wiedmannii TaxID=1890302 RepID=A0ABX5DKF2_9BACI|nr:HNH endonuclease [Bacillus wiedmannii]PRT35403.1 HNH endonuclease [Bacillus wiedmannii]
MFAKTSSAVKRNTPGTVTSSFNLKRSLGTKKKLMYNDGAIGVIPQEVREKLVGREFSSFDEFRKEFWKTIAESSYAEEFQSRNIKLMSKGLAPFAPDAQQHGKHGVYVLHHKQPIHQGGAVYDLDNLIIVSPKMHQNILDRSYHFGTKGQ